MLYRIAVLWEFIAVVVCIHAIYNIKIKLDIKLVALVLVTLGTIELILRLNWNNVTTLCVFVFMVVYCVCKFKDNFLGAIISTLLMLIVTGMLQFVFLLPFCRVSVKYEELRMLLINSLVAVSSLWILPKVKIYKLREIIRRREKFVFLIFLAILFVTLLLTIKWKAQGKISISFFVLTIPALMILMWLLIKWDLTENEKELVQNELTVTKTMQREYDDLLTSVRLREHGFKNHLAALLSLKYTSNSYEELVRQQDNYYGKIRDENRYNKLLFLGDSTISGFLYEKFCQAEDEEIFITYEIKGSFSGSMMPMYHIIEILGILIDNAIEAQSEKEQSRQLEFLFEEQKNKYLFKVTNPYVYASYQEIESWFLQNKSSKGKNRGLGLYYVKKLCEKYDGYILCRNIARTQENWIEMLLEIKKADKS